VEDRGAPPRTRCPMTAVRGDPGVADLEEALCPAPPGISQLSASMETCGGKEETLPQVQWPAGASARECWGQLICLRMRLFSQLRSSLSQGLAAAVLR